ncbi:MAG: 16S rRNA (adenine(1518)-N(6)/adenine(1519)-N(6))-dimethyltransferase RsmA [Promethearchaeota archaeon]
MEPNKNRYFLSRMQVEDLVKREGFLLSKGRGQSILHSWPTIERVVELSGFSSKDRVLEVGPGLGALTFNIAPLVEELICIELDPAFCSYLERVKIEHHVDNVRIINGDALKEEFPRSVTRIVSAMPYSISAPLIFKFLEHATCNPVSIHVICQREFALKLVAEPGSRHYSRISVSVAFFSQARVLMNISRNNFYPVPRVDSSFVEIKPNQAHSREAAISFKKLVSLLFPYKNKTLRKALLINLKLGRLRLKSRADVDLAPFVSSRVNKLGVDELLEVGRWLGSENGDFIF